MTVLINGANSYFFGSRAFLLDEDSRDTASDWSSKYIQHNPALKWVVGKFVEANNPNGNKQAWSLDDLRLKRPTINHAPMNMLHVPKNIVGAFVANELIYPTDSVDEAYQSQINPYIEVVGAFWKYFFPEELKVVQRAHDEGSLFFSMECVADTVTFEDVVSGETATFPYKGPKSETYGDWNTASNAIRWLDNPHFLAGALVIPPYRPGWSSADIKSLATHMDNNQEVAEMVYNGIQEESPHLSSKEIELVTMALLKNQVDEEIGHIVKNLNSNDDLSMLDKDKISSDEIASDRSHPEGGEMSTDSKTYTEDELNAAIEAAVQAALEPVNAELDQLRVKAAEDAVEARLEEMKAEYDLKIEEIQVQLDSAVIEAQTAREERDALQGLIDAEAAKEEAQAREEARLGAVKEVVNFPEEFIASQTERWVAMSDEDFEALVDGYKAAAEAAKAVAGDGKVEDTELLGTAMKATRDDDDKGGVDIATRRGIMIAARQGLDPRTI